MRQLRVFVHALGVMMAFALAGCGEPESKGHAAHPPGIGDVAVVVRLVHGTLASHDVRRVLAVSDDVYWRELIETEQESATEVEFVDGTRLTVGPDAQVNLDEFVYGGPPGTDRMVMTMTKGMSRFVTGSMDKAAYEIRAPGAIIGVRGTEFTIMVDPKAGTTLCLVHQGEVEIRRPDGSERVIVQPGQASLASSREDFGISPAKPTPPDLMRSTEQLRTVVNEAKAAQHAANAVRSKEAADENAVKKFTSLQSSPFGRDRLQDLAERLRSTGADRASSGGTSGGEGHSVVTPAALPSNLAASIATNAAAAVQSDPGGDVSKTVNNGSEQPTLASSPHTLGSADVGVNAVTPASVPIQEVKSTTGCGSADCTAVPLQSNPTIQIVSQTHLGGQ